MTSHYNRMVYKMSNTTSQQTMSTTNGNANYVIPRHVHNTNLSTRFPIVNVVDRLDDHHYNDGIRLSCKNDNVSIRGRNTKLDYSIEREKRRASDYRRHVGSEVKSISTQSVITGSNKLSCSDIYNIITRGRPSKEQRKFITRIISDKRDRKNNHTPE